LGTPKIGAGSMKDIPHGRYRGSDADGVAQAKPIS
jgi:hypothetical protein